jgi:glutathione S-transferase
VLKLYGFSVSNYYNVVKAALLEKGIEFEEVRVYPVSGQQELLALSPMGKVPYLETPQGPVSESQVMLDYLEDLQPAPNLYPTDAFARAKVRELLRVIELYLELPARRLYPEAFFGGKVSEQTKEEVRPALEQGVAALLRLARFEPFIAGNSFSYADLAAVIHLPLVRDAGKRIYGEELLAPLPDLAGYLQRIRERASLQRVLADYKQELDGFLKRRSAPA